ncbi:YceI family protein [Methylocella tundrae]|uniref:Lipid/polyisoprenoid-binding YceI-like domain-containing protein n=1 Tax=Methylocella tundrae TaxID=227605 RepID=A0A4U8Z1Z7_METTU|nr:YceI family protein [Methylocella tundrae]WPP03302.1 YceI family protein [Methylocella tundrae]VFU09335.1 conserved protein of unknown function [Methylocella tundrae]
MLFRFVMHANKRAALAAGHLRWVIAALPLVPMIAAPGAAGVNKWLIDPAQTHISFSVDAVGFPRTEGEFRAFDGRIAIDFEHPALSSVSFHVQAQSVDAGSPLLSDVLRSDAFFDAPRFAMIDFVSKRIEKIDEHRVRVAGELTMHGVTRPLAVEVAVRPQPAKPRARIAFTAKATIDRLAFGMTAGYPAVSREVALTVESEAVEH